MTLIPLYSTFGDSPENMMAMQISRLCGCCECGALIPGGKGTVDVYAKNDDGEVVDCRSYCPPCGSEYWETLT